MASVEYKSKPEKKKKASYDEKKRKRDHAEDGHRQKSKKHRADEPAKVNAEGVNTDSNYTPFQVQTSSLYLPLSPVSQKYPMEGLCAEHLSPLILQWYPPFNGVILSYSNPRISAERLGDDGDATLLRNIDEYAVSWAWVTAEFLLFRPTLGSTVEGHVNLQNEGHLGLVCWNLFSASIERKRLPAEWKWLGVEDMERGQEGLGMGATYTGSGAGYFVDGAGGKINGLMEFSIRDVETDVDGGKSFLSLAGTMLDAEAEKKLVESEKTWMNHAKDGGGRRLGGPNGLAKMVLSASATV